MVSSIGSNYQYFSVFSPLTLARCEKPVMSVMSDDANCGDIVNGESQALDCDLCGRWFHHTCIGISRYTSHRMCPTFVGIYPAWEVKRSHHTVQIPCTPYLGAFGLEFTWEF